MANAFVKAQFMDPPGGPNDPAPLGAVRAGAGITISASGVISSTNSGGTISDIVATVGLQGGGQGPQVFLGLLPPTDSVIGGVRTISGSGILIDSNGIIRSAVSANITGGVGILAQDLGGGAYNISLLPAGAASIGLGGVFIPPSSGLTLAITGGLTLSPPAGVAIGGVKAGTGVTIAPDGTLDATGTGGTITGVGAGTGLGGGGTTGAVTLFLRPATSNTIGGVYPGANVTVDPDGRLNVADAALGVLTVTGNTPVSIVGTVSNPTVTVNPATTLTSGVVQLSNAVNSTSEVLAASSLAVKTAYDVAAAALPLAGGTMTGNIFFSGAQTFPTLIPAASFTAKGGILAGQSATVGDYGLLGVGTDGQVLAANSAAPFGLEWIAAGTGSVTSVTGTAPIQVATGTTTPVISVSAASDAAAGIVQLQPDPTNTSTATVPSSFALSVVNQVALNCLPKAGGIMSGDITFAGAQVFPGTLPLAGGTMTGAITFNAGQTFPGVIAEGALSSTSPIVVGGTLSNPILSVSTATALALGVVQPDGTTITINGSGVISAAAGAASLPLAGGTMTGAIVFATGQTFTGTIANSLLTTTGDIIFASAASTPSRLGVGATGTILASNAGAPAYRTAVQLGLQTSASAATTYAPLNSPTFTGPVLVNGGGPAGSNAFSISGGNLVLATSFTPATSADTGSTGEVSWDANYFYVCVAPNSWGRIAIDTTPF